MNTTNEGATISGINLPEGGKITIELSDGKKITLTHDQVSGMIFLLNQDDPNQIAGNLRKGFMEVCVHKFVSDGDAQDIHMDKDFVFDFNRVCRFLEGWGKGSE
jgi:hypothetical protein